MKRLLSLALVLLSASCLFATLYRSNQLGQRLEVLTEKPGEGYFLEVEGDVSILHLDGEPIRKTTETIIEGSTFIEEDDLLTGEKTTRQFSDGLLVKESRGSERRTYGYIEGHLAFCSTTVDDEQTSIVFFLRSSADGALVAVREGESLRFVADSYLYQTGNLYQVLSNDMVFQGDFEVAEDGSIVYEEAGVTYVYNSEGLLLEARQGESVTTYTYQDGVLASTEKVDGKVRVVETYVDGKATESSVYENDVLTSSTEYREGGNVQTLYKDGRKVATVYYNEDNRTVERIEYN